MGTVYQIAVEYNSGNVVLFDGEREQDPSIKEGYESYFLMPNVRMIEIIDPLGEVIMQFRKKKGVVYPPTWNAPTKPVQLNLFDPPRDEQAIFSKPKNKRKSHGHDRKSTSAVQALVARTYSSN